MCERKKRKSYVNFLVSSILSLKIPIFLQIANCTCRNSSSSGGSGRTSDKTYWNQYITVAIKPLQFLNKMQRPKAMFNVQRTTISNTQFRSADRRVIIDSRSIIHSLMRANDAYAWLNDSVPACMPARQSEPAWLCLEEVGINKIASRQ